MRRSVSGDIPTVKVEVGSEMEVRVRQVPLMEMLSPRCASERMLLLQVIVREVPPPPPDVSSWGSRAVTAVRGLGG